MDLEVTQLEGATKLSLRGRLDSMGVDRVETRFTASVVPGARPTLVDLSGVAFMASMGIRMLVSTARALHNKNAKMVMFGAQPFVKETLERAAIDRIIPLVDDERQALEQLGA